MFLMRPTGTRRRRCCSLICVLLVGLNLVVLSCGGADKFELTLRARDDDGSTPAYRERHWLAADGRRATSPPRSGNMYVAAPKFADVECGGEPWYRRYVDVSGAEMASENDPSSFELTIDDGNTLTLDPQTAVRVADSTGAETECFEEIGRWHGTAGELSNRAGTFTIHYDSIQTVLQLIEE